MRRVRIIENHDKNIFIIWDKNEIKRVVQETKIESFNIKFINEFSMNKWEIVMIKDEITHLANELNKYNYAID